MPLLWVQSVERYVEASTQTERQTASASSECKSPVDALVATRSAAYAVASETGGGYTSARL